MEKEELTMIYGGASVLTSALINAAIKGFSLALELGRSLGSAIRRSLSKKPCAV